jgi:general secretion pathway protein D
VGNVDFTGAFDTVRDSSTAVTPASFAVLSNRLFGTGVDLSAAVRLLDEFGTSRALSSPRLNAMNNQQAVLTFAENIVYFKVKIKVTAAVPGTGGSAGTPAIIEVNSEENKAPVGILLSLQQTINKEISEITLSVRPTLTRVTQFVVDPSFPIQVAVALNNLTADSTSAELIEKIRNTDSRVPQIETRELDSILKVKSGQVMVIGGLLEDKITNTDSGLPGVSRVPYFGNLFKSVDKVNSKKELIIFIRATIVDPHGSASEADKALYRKFIQDPDPLRF